MQFNVLNHRIKFLNFIVELIWWQKKHKLAGMYFILMSFIINNFYYLIRVLKILFKSISVSYMVQNTQTIEKELLKCTYLKMALIF